MAFKRNLISKWTKVQDNRAKYAAKAAETQQEYLKCKLVLTCQKKNEQNL